MATVLVGEHRRRDVMPREAKILFGIAFVYFLMAGLVLRVIPFGWRRTMMPSQRSRSLIGQASEAARSTVSFAFMR